MDIQIKLTVNALEDRGTKLYHITSGALRLANAIYESIIMKKEVNNNA